MNSVTTRAWRNKSVSPTDRAMTQGHWSGESLLVKILLPLSWVKSNKVNSHTFSVGGKCVLVAEHSSEAILFLNPHRIQKTLHWTNSVMVQFKTVLNQHNRRDVAWWPAHCTHACGVSDQNSKLSQGQVGAYGTIPAQWCLTCSNDSRSKVKFKNHRGNAHMSPSLTPPAPPSTARISPQS